jgi:hypothetical protein
MGKNKGSGAPDRIARNKQDQGLARETVRDGAHCASMGYGENWKPSLHAVLLALGVWAFLIGAGLAAISVHGMGGGSVAWGNREAVRLMQRAIDAGEPIRLEPGHYTSAGAMLLYAVERTPGSCVHPDALFHFHEPQSMAAALIMCAPLSGEERIAAAERYALLFTPALRAWFMAEVVGDTPSCGFTTLTGADLARFGYPTCEGEE